MATDYSSTDPTGIDYNPPTRLTRATDGRMIGGVCAGLARRYGWDVNLIRVLFVLSCLLPGPQVLAYLALWVIIPSDR